MGTLRLSYVSLIAQVGKRGQGNSGRDGIWDWTSLTSQRAHQRNF